MPRDASLRSGFVDPGPVSRLPAVLSGTVDGAILRPEERHAAVDQGMRDLMFMGREVKNPGEPSPQRIGSLEPKLMASTLVTPVVTN